jgi:hypothetical protein
MGKSGIGLKCLYSGPLKSSGRFGGHGTMLQGRLIDGKLLQRHAAW